MNLEKNNKNKQTPAHLLKGFKDVLPEEAFYFDKAIEAGERLAKLYGFKKIITPVLEETRLYKRTTGEGSDIVQKEMFSFEDLGGDQVSLRPEFTPGFARAYLEHGLINLPQPVKLYSVGPLFRYEKPQTGRFRQFWQLNFEVIGEKNPIVDAQLIILANQIFKELNVPIDIYVNSIGCPVCRKQYLPILVRYLKNKKNTLCESCLERLKINPLRVLDCKEEQCQEFLNQAPQILDHLCEECQAHFTQVVEYLDTTEVVYELKPRLVRGLDYYTRTTFEIFPKEEEHGRQSALAGGGRYDELLENIGGRPIPAAGYAIGLERVVAKLKEGRPDAKISEVEVFVAQLGMEARKKCLKIYEDLIHDGFKVAENFAKDGLAGQLEMANKLGSKFTVILGQKELLDKTIIIRDMESGVQEIVDIEKISLELKKRLDKLKINLTS